MSQLCKLSQLCSHFFVAFWLWQKINFDIPSNPLPIAVRNSLTNQFFQKIYVLYIFNKKSAKLKRREGSRDPSLLFSFAKNGNKVATINKVGTFQLFKLSKHCYHIWSSFENGNNFFLISLAIPHPSRSGIH